MHHCMEIDTHKMMIKKSSFLNFFKGQNKKTPSNAVEPISSRISVLTLTELTEFEVLQFFNRVKHVYCHLLK